MGRARRRFWDICAGVSTTLGLGFTGTGDGILMYHSVRERFGNPGHCRFTRAAFRRQLKRLTEVGTVVSLERLLTESAPDQKRFALTFDDGYDNFRSSALPELRLFDAPATLFVVPGKVGGSWRQDGYNESVAMLSWSNLDELATDPLVTIGNHSLTHANLPSLNEQAIRTEVNDAKDRLEARLDIEVNTFCYPGGKYDQAVRRLVGEHHEWGVTVEPGLVTADYDPLTLPRVNGAWPAARVGWELSDYGAWTRRTFAQHR